MNKLFAFIGLFFIVNHIWAQDCAICEKQMEQVVKRMGGDWKQITEENIKEQMMKDCLEQENEEKACKKHYEFMKPQMDVLVKGAADGKKADEICRDAVKCQKKKE
ncbi:unnamed protein product, partial [Mesorhabditis belari]|uniref:Saposin B-type domain-containing protein n=1 Tax=Mesorhabditis belari TaxID=2138241 RepID=A0AAF3FNV2_9BILA